MDKMKVGQLLYAEFGDKEFSAGQISNGAMAKLVQEMGITETARPDLDSLVSKLLESLNGRAFQLQTGGPAYFDVHWSEKTHKSHSFQVIPIDVSGSKETVWASDELVGVEYPDAEMAYTVVLTYSEEGYAVECPALKAVLLPGRQRRRSPGKHQGSHYWVDSVRNFGCPEADADCVGRRTGSGFSCQVG